MVGVGFSVLGGLGRRVWGKGLNPKPSWVVMTTGVASMLTVLPKACRFNVDTTVMFVVSLSLTYPAFQLARHSKLCSLT